MDALGTICKLWQNDDGTIFVSPEYAPRVERAMREWAEKRRDAWLSLTGPCGEEYGVLASTINCMLVSTPEQRAACILRERMIQDERAEHRRAAGYIESE